MHCVCWEKSVRSLWQRILTEYIIPLLLDAVHVELANLKTKHHTRGHLKLQQIYNIQKRVSTACSYPSAHSICAHSLAHKDNRTLLRDELQSTPVQFNRVHTPHSSRVNLFTAPDLMLLVEKIVEIHLGCKAKSLPDVSQTSAVRVAVAWTHGNALFLTHCLDECRRRGLKHLPWKSHSSVCWVPSKVLDLLAEKVSPDCKHRRRLLTTQLIITNTYLYLLSHL